MGHPTQAYFAMRKQTDPIIDALSRVRGAGEVGALLGRHKQGTSYLDYVRSLADASDVAMLEIMLADARTARNDIEQDIARIIKKVKSSGDTLSDKAEQYRREMHDKFEVLLDAQDAVSAIRDDLNVIKDIVQA